MQGSKLGSAATVLQTAAATKPPSIDAVHIVLLQKGESERPKKDRQEGAPETVVVVDHTETQRAVLRSLEMVLWCLRLRLYIIRK